jgi:hypothetical protein
VKPPRPSPSFINSQLNATKLKLMRPFTFTTTLHMSLPICLLILSNQIVHLLAFPIQSSFSFPNDCSDDDWAPSPSYIKNPPTINSVRPSSIQNPSVMLGITTENAATVLQTNDLFIEWEWSAQVSLAKRSQKIRINNTNLLTDSFFIDLEFEKNTTGACDLDNSSSWDRFCPPPPLWKRQTYFHVRLVKKNECIYTSEKSEKHGRMLRPCPAGTYMRIFKQDKWFDESITGLNKLHYEGIGADAFLDFSYRPDEHNAVDATTCLPCEINRGKLVVYAVFFSVLYLNQHRYQMKIRQGAFHTKWSMASLRVEYIAGESSCGIFCTGAKLPGARLPGPCTDSVFKSFLFF